MRVLLAAAATVVVVAGLKVAAPIVNFFLLALFVAVAAAAPVDWLQQRGLRPGLGVLAVVVTLLLILGAITLLLADSLGRMGTTLPRYQAQLDANLEPWLGWLEAKGVELARPSLFPDLDPKNVLGLVAGFLGNVGSLLSNMLLILLVAIFMLLDGTAFQRQVQAISPNPSWSISQLTTFTRSLRHYLAVKTCISLATGIGAGLWCALVGLDFPVIWGLLAFFFNFIPNVGSILAAIPAALLALAQGGLTLSVLVVVGFMAINLLIGYWLEPRVMGRSVGLSASVVMLSLIFWGWVLGAVGMILAVPLTVTLKLALASSDDTRWLATLLDTVEAERST